MITIIAWFVLIVAVGAYLTFSKTMLTNGNKMRIAREKYEHDMAVLEEIAILEQMYEEETALREHNKAIDPLYYNYEFNDEMMWI